MNAPPSAFAQAFRQHVIPAMRPRFGAIAYRILCGGLTFSEGVAELMTHAHGATMLDAATLGQFQDWLGAQLIIALDRHERVARDIERCLRTAYRENRAA